uniref:CSON002756 protein n=1 Tax=Culicoides sonorensis TaxID=179676 RepID=A0A336ML67_CULSO
MDEYYEWIKELLKEENIDLDLFKTTKNPAVLTGIHEAVRDLRDSLEIVRQDIGFVEKNIYSKAKVNKCAVHGDQLVISSSDSENFLINASNLGNSSTATSTQERPLKKLPKKIRERHISSKTKSLYHGLPYYFPDDESDSPDSSDIEALKNRCKRLKEQYTLLEKKKSDKKSHKKRVPSKVTSGSQTTSDALSSTLDSRPEKSNVRYTDTDDYSSGIRVKKTSRIPPKPTKYVTPELVPIDYTKPDSEGIPTVSEPESVIFLGDKKSADNKKTRKHSKTDKSEKSDKKRSKKDRKKKEKPPKTETAIQTSPDKDQQRYARSRLLQSDRPKSARPERCLIRTQKYMCFLPEQPQNIEKPEDETLKVTTTISENLDETSNKLVKQQSFEFEQFPSEQQSDLISNKTEKPRSKSCTREITDSSLEAELRLEEERSKLKKKSKKLGKDFSSQTDLAESKVSHTKENTNSKGVQFSYEDLVNLNDIDRTPIRKKTSGSQTDLCGDEKPISILKRTLTEPTITLKNKGQKPKFVSIVDSGNQTSFDRTDQTQAKNNQKELIQIAKTTTESQTGDSLISKIDGDCQTSIDYQRPTFKFETYKSADEMQQVNAKSGNMATQINLHIKVSSNVQMDGNGSEQEPDTTKDEKSSKSEDKSPNLVQEETLTVDNQKLTIRVISEENLCVSQSNDGEIDVKRNSTENLDITQPSRYRSDMAEDSQHLDIDDISVHSMSEGDNSVFTDGHVTPTEPCDVGAVGGLRNTRKSHTDQSQQEEVDDIELIFSSEDKDFAQEDLVSLTEYEPWQEAGGSGTPILVKMDNNKKQASVERDVDHVKMRRFKLNKQDSGAQTDAEPKFQSIESNETYGSYGSKNLSGDFSSKTHSMDKESSFEQETISREESFDTFEQAVGSTIQRRWTKASILVETDISKCGITEEIKEEMLMGFPRRNTCPNPAPYRPILHSNPRQKQAVKFVRSPRTYASHFQAPKTCLRTKISETETDEYQRCSSAVQTDISALPPQWRSESHLTTNEYGIGLYTLPSKFETPVKSLAGFKCPLRLSEKTQENRRVLLSDINFTSMVPELSRSADHICPDGEMNESDEDRKSNDYYKGHHLQTPDYTSKGLTPSYSLTSPGMSNWTVNEGSQTTQTGGYWDRGDSFDSSKSFSMQSANLEKHHRSRSVPSIRCIVCRQTQSMHTSGMRISESMNYGSRGVHHETPQKCRGSLPDLRHHCACRRYDGPSLHQIHAESEESTESLIEEPEEYLRVSSNSIANTLTLDDHLQSCGNRRRSENDIGQLFTPPACQVPFLPRTPETLKVGNLAKVILKSGRIAVGRIRFVGSLNEESAHCNKEDDTFIGIHLPSDWGDTDGTYDGKKFFDCPPLHGVFVPFNKIVMAWNV